VARIDPSLRRGTVFISPVAFFVAAGRMVDPATAAFWVSWQAETLIEDDTVAGAEDAIAWGRERSERVLIRLGHDEESHFSAGAVDLSESLVGSGRAYPRWPPTGTPPQGWWTEVEEAAAEAAARLRQAPASKLGLLEPEIRRSTPGGDSPADD
jgi:hypothetical protein